MMRALMQIPPKRPASFAPFSRLSARRPPRTSPHSCLTGTANSSLQRRRSNHSPDSNGATAVRSHQPNSPPSIAFASRHDLPIRRTTFRIFLPRPFGVRVRVDGPCGGGVCFTVRSARTCRHWSITIGKRSAPIDVKITAVESTPCHRHKRRSTVSG